MIFDRFNRFLDEHFTVFNLLLFLVGFNLLFGVDNPVITADPLHVFSISGSSTHPHWMPALIFSDPVQSWVNGVTPI